MRLLRAVVGPVLVLFLAIPSLTFAAGSPTPPAAAPAASPAASPPPSLTTAPSPSATIAADPTATDVPAVTATDIPTEPPAATDTTAPTEVAAPPVAPAPPAAAPAAPVLADDAFTIWHGVVREGGAYRRSAPGAYGEILEELAPGTPLRVDGWVAGDMFYPDVYTWGAIDEADGGGYVFGGALAGVLPQAVPPVPDNMADTSGNWVDVNLTLNVITAYVDGQPAKMILTSPGRPGYETDTGIFRVYSRLYSQTMTGPGYSVPGVPNVQYFYGGEALHGRYWTLPDVPGTSSLDIDETGAVPWADAVPIQGDGPNLGVAFGVPSSHGCLGMQVEDSAWLYNVLSYGSIVNVHY